MAEDETAQDQQAQSDADSDIMHVRVQAPYKTYYDGDAKSITAQNDTGEFDILGKHHNFISILSAGDIIIRKPDNEKEKITIQQGVMHVKANEVVVFLDV